MASGPIEVAGGSGRCRLRVTDTGFRAASEHFCRGAAATSQDVIPGF
ncbi:hypothetical protein ACFQ4I_08580 [Methylorubrum suomiense]